MEDGLLIETVKEFINLCDKLLEQGKISEEEYHDYTRYKKEFLSKID